MLLTHAKHELFAGRTTPITCKELSHAQYERYLRAKGELVYPWGPPLSMLVPDGQCAPSAYERQLPPHSFTSAPLSHKQVQRVPNDEILPPLQSDDINTIAVREKSVVDAAKPCTGFMFDAPVRLGKGAGGLYEQPTFAHKASQLQTHRSTNAITTAQESPTVSHATASSELMPDAASDLVETSSAHGEQCSTLNSKLCVRSQLTGEITQPARTETSSLLRRYDKAPPTSQLCYRQRFRSPSELCQRGGVGEPPSITGSSFANDELNASGMATRRRSSCSLAPSSFRLVCSINEERVVD